ncbi:MAG: 1,4-alpha-glucan branching protein GlgB [Lentisphaerae bacterium]|nr:1,4-alpha-glucan branching protein GlgB [Lentisphaerota bacterium]
MKPILSEPEINAIIYGMHGAPFTLLGQHETGKKRPGVVIRVFRPYATQAEVVRISDGKAFEMPRIHADGLYERFFPGEKPFAYRLRLTWFDGTVSDLEDPYRFPLQMTDLDMYLLGEGTNYRAYTKMGAHPLTVDGIDGVHFAVWAPNAIRVSVVGWFNNWDGRIHPMQQRGSSGLWELFIPHLKPGDLYKFEVKGHKDFLAQKADPYAFASELRPRSASMVWDIDRYEWNDADWMQARKPKHWLEEPISVYEVHLGSWRRNPDEDNRMLTYRELADTLFPYVKKMGYTHIETMPISEHPFDGSWGYQTIGYYSPTSRFGTPDDFKYFVDQCHQEGIGVIVDWVPAHFPKDGHGLAYFDGTHLYEHDDPRLGEHKDWGTYIFNYGRNEVRAFLLSNAIFLADVYHIDGLRVDAVASMLYLDYSRNEGEWIPNKYGGRENLEAVDFLKKFNELIHVEYPGFLTFAEESTAWPMVSRPVYLGGLGFDLKWNMGWMNDTLDYMHKNPLFRKYHHHEMTFSLIYAFNENFILPFSHDEVVHGKGSMLSKMPGDMWQQFANLRLLYAFMFAHPGKKLTFMGMEFGQWREWQHNESLDWHLLQYDSHSGLQRLARDLNAMLKGFACLHQIDFSWEGFEWIDLNDWENSTLFTLRKGKSPDDLMVCGFNFTPVPREGYRMGVPHMGTYEEVLNTDATIYGGSGMGNSRFVRAEPQEWQSRAQSIPVTIPPLGAVFFRYRPDMNDHV